MKLHQAATYTLFAIAAIAIAPAMALAQMSSLSQIAEAPLQEVPVIHSTMSTPQSFFTHPPSLIRANALQKTARTPSTYEFTITVPVDAGASLKSVTIVQDPNLETIRFNVPQSQAFAGKRYAAGPVIPLASIGGEQDPPGTATIVFDQPVQPGSVVTIAVEVKANPGAGGIYEFGVTAYPTDENGRGQFLGYGRIHLYGNN